ncbi:MAG: hypothetical protein ACQERU_05530 [Bacteroidota bacterium]
MKKILSIFIFLGLIILNACDPMEDIYEEIDAKEDYVTADVSFTLTADDYATASGYALKYAESPTYEEYAEKIEEMEAFNIYYTAEEYVPFILGEKYNVLNKNSVAVVTYNKYLGGLDYLDNFGNAESYELTTDDYDSMGEEFGDPGYYNNFSSYEPPEEYLPDFLLGKYPSAEADDMIAVTYKYYSGTTEDITDYYTFDGSEWAPVQGAYVLTGDDYDSMGDPGAYDNFSGSVPPEDYLPTFLKMKYPYAQSGDQKVIVYKYYSGGVSTRAKEYHFDGSEWTEYDAIVEETNQFIHNGAKWVFDPTETYTMESSDYQIIVDYVKDNFGDDYLDSYGTQEFYYGAGAYYSNFDLRAGKWNSEEFETWDEAVKEALGTILLPAVFPNATLQVNGVDMYYRVVFDTYSGSAARYAMKFQVTKAGPDPEFTFVEGPTLL